MLPIALLVKRDTWIKKVHKMARIDSASDICCTFLSWSWPTFCTEKNWTTLVQNIWPRLQQIHKKKCWRLKIVFCKYQCTSYLGETFDRVQLVLFSILSRLRSVHFVTYKYKKKKEKTRVKYIRNIWMRIKWEVRLTNQNWPPLMDPHQ